MPSRQAIHLRRQTLARLRERTMTLPPLVVADLGKDFAVSLNGVELLRGRYQIIATYLQGWTDALNNLTFADPRYDVHTALAPEDIDQALKDQDE